MKSSKLLLFIVFLIIFNCLLADVAVEAFVDRNRVSEGEVIRLTIEARGENLGNVPNPELPNMNFSVLGSSRSTSSQVSFVNGRMTSTRSERITFNLRADTQGTFNIPPISLTINNQVFVTRPIQIVVTEATAQQQQQQQRTQQQGGFAQRQPQQTQADGSETFILATVDKTNVFRNEKIVVHYKLYTQSQIQNIAFAAEPAFTGFWKEDLFQANRLQMQREVHEGRQYNTLLLRSVALFPSREGELTIPSIELNIDVAVPGRTFWDFGTTRRINVASRPITVRANPLPPVPDGRNFIGAVGRFDVSSSISANEGEAGNSLTYRIVLNGTGNFNQTLIPRLPDVQGLRFLTAETEDVRNQSGTQFSGRRTFIYPVIMQESGTITIPEMDITWFDPTTRRFVSRTLAPQTINVRPSEQHIIATPGGQQAIRVLGRDIQFIDTNPSVRNFRFLYQSFVYWLLLLLFPLSLGVHYFYIYENRKLSSDTLYRRDRRAMAIMKKYMRDADRYARANSIEFYNAAYIGLSHFVTDKLNLPRGSVEKLMYEALRERGVAEELVNNLQKGFEKINFVKFSNANIESVNIKEDIELITELIQGLMGELSKKKVPGVKR